jgi:hypothetical protein
MNLEELIERHIAAVGGREYLATLESVRLQGKLHQVLTGKIEFDVLKMRPDLIKISVGEGAYLEGYDGKTAWEKRAFAKAETLKGAGEDALRRAAEWPSIICSLEDFRARGHGVELEATEIVDGMAYYVICLTLRDGHKRRYFIDPETFYFVRARDLRPLHLEEETHQIETLSSDFRIVDGIPVAFKNEERNLGTGEILVNIVWETVTLNPHVSEKEFQMPKNR